MLPRQGSGGDALVLRAYQRCEWYELALMRHGFTSERLMKLSRKVANDELNLRGGRLKDFDDLVSRLQIAGLEAALKYDPLRRHASYGQNGGEPFASYVADIMGMRVVDHYRSKAEGFGDRRKGHDNMIDLSDDPDPADHDMDFETLIDDRRRAKWAKAAELAGFHPKKQLSEWIVTVLDIAADEMAAA
jgi:hypothetical protein